MGFMRHIRACNYRGEEVFLPWRIGQGVYGWIRPAFAEHLRDFPGVFEVRADAVCTPAPRRGGPTLTGQLQLVAASLAREEVVVPLLGEPYPVTAGGREAAIASVDRVMAAYLGLRSFGQHLNGYVRDGQRIMMVLRRFMWIPESSPPGWRSGRSWS